MKPRNSFKHKITVTLVICSIVPLLLLGFFSVYAIDHISKENLKSTLKDALETTSQMMNQSIKELKEDFERLVSDNDFKTIISDMPSEIETNENVMMHFYKVFSRKARLTNLYVVYPNGSAIVPEELPKLYDVDTFYNWGIFRELDQVNDIVIYPSSFIHQGEKIALSLGQKVTLKNNNIAYIILDVSSEFLQDIMRSVKNTNYGYIQFIITYKNNEIIFNDSMFKSSLNFIDNLFVKDQYNETVRFSNSLNFEHFEIDSLEKDSLNLKYFGLISNEMITSQNKEIMVRIVIFIFISLILLLLSGLFLGNSVSRPILNLASLFTSDRNNIKNDSIEKRNDEISEVYFQIRDMIQRLKNYHEQDLEKQELIKEIEIKALMSQMNPHFLYNTLDSIKWLAKLNETSSIVSISTELGYLLKESMDTNHSLISIEEELQFVESYMMIQKFRYGNRFEFYNNISEESKKITIPKLIIQPLIENAIIHGIEKKNEKGSIELNVWSTDKQLFISVKDNGEGTHLTLDEILSAKNTRIGLKNVDRRIKLYYGDDYGIRFDSQKNSGTIVYIEIPIKIKEQYVSDIYM